MERRARAQHAALELALRSAGWHNVTVHVIAFGYCGAIPHSLAHVLDTLGVPRSRVRALARTLHISAITSTRAYVRAFNDLFNCGDPRTLHPP